MKLFFITLDKDYNKTKLKELVLLYQKKQQTNKHRRKQNKTKQNKKEKKRKQNKTNKKNNCKVKAMPLLWTRNSFKNQIDLQRSFKSVA